MSDLEEFQLPYTTDEGHQLNWTPGNYGKGAVLEDGSIHHWNTIAQFSDGDPTHHRYLREKGLPSEHTPFWINPEGELHVFSDQSNRDSYLDQIQNVDLRLRASNGGLHFADTRTQQRALDQEQEFWDKELQYDYPQETEWVPTHELKRFFEYDRRPGGADAHSDPERWNALRNHIEQNGLANPVMLEFNPNDGTAHMGEGHHRTQIALDAGIPALPVRVYRSRRTSPTMVRVNAQPQPEWEDRFSESGYHWPQNIKPSHIGLPTVPEPGQEADNNWSLGKTSNFNILEGEGSPGASAWNLIGRPDTHHPALYGEPGGQPTIYLGKGGTHHADLVREFGLPHANDWAFVDTQGVAERSPTFPPEALDHLKRHISEIHGTKFLDHDSDRGWTFT